MRILTLLNPSTPVPGCRAVGSAGALQLDDGGDCSHVGFDPRATDMTQVYDEQCVSFEERPQNGTVQYGATEHR